MFQRLVPFDKKLIDMKNSERLFFTSPAGSSKFWSNSFINFFKEIIKNASQYKRTHTKKWTLFICLIISWLSAEKNDVGTSDKDEHLIEIKELRIILERVRISPPPYAIPEIPAVQDEQPINEDFLEPMNVETADFPSAFMGEEQNFQDNGNFSDCREQNPCVQVLHFYILITLDLLITPCITHIIY